MEEIEEIRITTIDNPFDPFEDWDNWFRFDIDHGYNTCSKLGRLVKYKNAMTIGEENLASAEAIKRLIEIDPFKVYKEVHKSKK